MIYGAIIGDIVGSRFEFNNYKGTDFEPLFAPDCKFTDDSLMTIAVAAAIYTTLHRDDLPANTIHCMQKIGRPYRDVSWGANFGKWLYSDDPKPYDSFGNGAAMRVSACGWFGQTIEEVIDMADRVTTISHSHEEGIRGARAVATAVYIAQTTHSKRRILEEVGDYYPILHDPDFTLNNIRPTYGFDESCQGTVPQAVQAFMESDGFEDAIRKAVSIGGDSDTVAAITGSIAEAYYGVPAFMKICADCYFDDKSLTRLIHGLEASLNE